MKLNFLILAILLVSTSVVAQVKVGDNPTTINASAVLEAESTTKGFLPPRMTTAQRDAISNPVVGLMIYNTDTRCTESFLGIGVQGTSATGWKNLCKANINATFQSSTLNCSGGTLAGDYVATVPMTTANYKIVTVTTLSAGDYTASTDEQNGVSFSAEGTISSIGTGTQLKLMASGTPINDGAFTYTVTLSGQTCTFSVTFLTPPAELLNNEVNCTAVLPAGSYMAGVPMTSSNTKSVNVTPTSVGYCNLQTDVQNGVSFSGTTTFTAGQLNSVQTMVLTATGTPVTAGTFTYTVSGTNVTSTCTFTVTFSCLNVFTGFSASPNTAVPGINARFTVTAPSAGKFILSGSANAYRTATNGSIVYKIKNGATIIADGSFIRPTAPYNVNQNIAYNGEFNVSAAGSYNIDYVLTAGVSLTNAKLEYIFVPSACSNSGTLTTGKYEGARSVNNTPATGNHRFTVTAPGAGRFLLFSKMSMYTAVMSNSLSYDLKYGSTVLANGIQSLNTIPGVWQQIKTNGYLDVAVAGSYNIDLVPQTGFSGVTDPMLYWIFVPSSSNITSGSISASSVNNTPATDNHRFTLTAPGAGKYVLFGSMNMWKNSNNTFGYDVKNGSTTLEQVRVNWGSPDGYWQQLPFATEVAVAAAGTVNIDIVPGTLYSGIGKPRLMWVFIPN